MRHQTSITTLAAALLAALGIAPLAARAATIVVNSTADPGTASTCTLRQAIVSMNTGAVTGSCVNTGAAFGSGDTIYFSGGLFSGNTATITLADQPYNSLAIYPANAAHLQQYTKNLTIDAGAGRNVTVQRSPAGKNQFTVMDVHSSSANGTTYVSLTATLSGLTLQYGVADSQCYLAKYLYTCGGGLRGDAASIVLDHSVVRKNAAQVGAGVFMNGGRSLVMRSSVVRENTATVAGSGVGGISAISISDSTFEGNNNNIGGGVIFLGTPTGSLSIANSTVSGNADSAIEFVASSSTLSMVNTTIACNQLGGGRIMVSPKLQVNAISTIFADTTNSTCSTGVKQEFITNNSAPVVIAGDHNLVANNGAVDNSVQFPADTIFGDPLLGPLQNNGGPTPTHALGAGSPAIDAGSNPAGFAYDQRGAPFSRFVGKAPDIGAYESVTSHLCGSAWGKSFVTLSSSSPNLCVSGAYLYGGVVSGSGPWAWVCAASGVPAPPPTEFCGAQVQANVNLLIENASGGIISSAIYGQPLHLKTVIADARSSGTTTPTGTVSFFDTTGGSFVPLCVNSALSSGETVCDTTNTPIDTGARQLEAVYNGDGTFGTAASSPGAVTINPATSTTTIISQTPNPVAADAPFTVVAKVVANTPSVATPTGTVEIDDLTDGLSCTYELADATPGCAITPISVSTHTLRIVYLGNGNMSSSQTTGTETVGPPTDRIFANGFE